VEDKASTRNLFPCTQKEAEDSFLGKLEEWYTITNAIQNHIGQFFLYEYGEL
jgi:hypothetical protein